MAAMVAEKSSLSSMPSISAPRRITSREQPAANFLSLNFLATDLASMPSSPVGRIRAAAPISPVSSSVAKRTFSMVSSGSTSMQIP